jgi:hypothetical protein
VQKGRGVTNLTGEKLYEGQVIQAVQDATRQHGLGPRFFMMVADEEHPSYSLFVEGDASASVPLGDLTTAVDERLSELNMEYGSKRASGRLPALTVSWLRPGAGEAYKTACVRAGQREGQFKPVVLLYRSKLSLPLEPYVAG